LTRFRRIVQGIAFALFLALLIFAALDLAAPTDLFLRMDPVLVLTTALASRAVMWAFLPAALVLLACLLAGRFFCGYICPMGATLDVTDSRIGPERRPPGDPEAVRRLTRMKYGMLAWVLGAAAFGVSLVFWVSPLALVTRLYGLVIYPVVLFFSARGLTGMAAAIESLGGDAFSTLAIRAVRFDGMGFVVLFFVAVFAAARWSPRFWCRNLCPAGAMMAFFSGAPWVRRHVGDACVDCGQCARGCPMGAIPIDDPVHTRFRECIVCGACQDVCPVQAVDFRSGAGKAAGAAPFMSRRRFLLSGLAGAGTAAVTLTGLSAPGPPGGHGFLAPPDLIRPPAALPEPAFLSRCVRCGACMVACPSNTLQPIGFAAGHIGLFSPRITPRRGFCDPRCHRCAQACPTGAISRVPACDRIWAKTGTAVIDRQRCLAWEHRKSCMVCDEVCPFDAIDFLQDPGNPYAVPHVAEDRCAGCGYCEHFCPVQNRSAIVVTPMGALRLPSGGYRREGLARGLSFRLRSASGKAQSESMDAAPGFDAGIAPDPDA